MRTQVESTGDDVNSNISFHFALARAHEADEDFEGAWQHYELGNSAKRSAVQYDPGQIETSHDAIIELFDHEFLEQRECPAGDGPAPIFILGMPRSGSTLLEQILASHSDVEGAAELPYIGLLSEALGGPRSNGKQYPAVLADMTPDQFVSFGKSYVYDLNECAEYYLDYIRVMDHWDELLPGRVLKGTVRRRRCRS